MHEAGLSSELHFSRAHHAGDGRANRIDVAIPDLNPDAFRSRD